MKFFKLKAIKDKTEYPSHRYFDYSYKEAVKMYKEQYGLKYKRNVKILVLN